MPELVACPACGCKVQMADALLGRTVRCQSCGGAFVAAPDAGPPQPPPAPRPRRRRERAPARRDLVPALGDHDPPFCPGCGKPVGWDMLCCPFCGVEFEPEAGAGIPRGRPPDFLRRDSAPHRGRLLVTLGNVCLVTGGLSLCLLGLGALVSVPLGVVVWLMANHDLAQMRAGAVDGFGRDQTETGRTGAILGIVLGLLFAACHALWWLRW